MEEWKVRADDLCYNLNVFIRGIYKSLSRSLYDLAVRKLVASVSQMGVLGFLTLSIRLKDPVSLRARSDWDHMACVKYLQTLVSE